MADTLQPDESRLCEEGLVFFGRVMAGQCHELTNVFNVVNELAGLQEDLLPRAREGHGPALEKIADLTGRIQAQIKRGQTIIRNCHQFSHSVDAPWTVFDARDVVGRVVFFASRQTRLRQTELAATVPDEAVALESNPFWLQQAIYLGIELLLDGAAAHRRLAVLLAPLPEGASVTITSADAAPDDAFSMMRLTAITEMVELLGGEVREAPRHVDADRLVLFVPHSHGGAPPAEPEGAGAGGAGGGR